jgi:hypothetical protein
MKMKVFFAKSVELAHSALVVIVATLIGVPIYQVKAMEKMIFKKQNDGI